MSVQEVFLVKKGGTAESKTFRPFTKGWKVFFILLRGTRCESRLRKS